MVGEGFIYVVLPGRPDGSELCRDDLEASDGIEVPGVEFDLLHTIDDGVDISAGDNISISLVPSILCRPMSPAPPSSPIASVADLFLNGSGRMISGTLTLSPDSALLRPLPSAWARKDS